LNHVGQLLDLDASQLDNDDAFLTKLCQLQTVFHATQNRLDTYDVLLPTIQQNYVDMNNLVRIINE
jgi:hypothetical protein